MELGLEIYGDEMQAAQLEVLIKILAHQKATLLMLCDNKAKSIDEADSLYSLCMADCDRYGSEIFQDLYVRRGQIDPNDILPKK